MFSSNFGHNGSRLTPTEQDIFDVMRDGKRHEIPELLRAIGYTPPDGLATFQVHFSRMKKKIERFGIDILSEWSKEGPRVVAYTFVRRIRASHE